MDRRALILILPATMHASAQRFSPSELERMEWQTHVLINQERQHRRLHPLDWSEHIAAEARDHARAMAAGRTPFSHQGFEERTRRLPAHRAAAENLAMEWSGPDAPRRAVQHWLESPGHARNIRSDKYQLTGIGIAQRRDQSIYFVQLFTGS